MMSLAVVPPRTMTRMTSTPLLRVRIAQEWNPAHPTPWVACDRGGRVTAAGRDAAAAWPEHDELHVVLAPAGVRIVALDLPPMTPERLLPAMRYALEDQIAGAEATVHVAPGPRAGDRVLAIVAPRDLLSALERARSAALRRLSRVIAEPELAASGPVLRWCIADGENIGFLRTPDGSALPVSRAATAELPIEVQLAAKSAAGVPVRVEWDAPDALLAAWQQQIDVPVERGAAWTWIDAAPAEFAAATNLLLHAADASAPWRMPLPATRALRPAAILLACAATLHVFALLAQWGGLAFERRDRAARWQTLAVATGMPPSAARDADDAAAAIARKLADSRHARRMPTADDALPLLARASRVASTLPVRSVKRMAYADGHWTVDLALADAAQTAAFAARLRAAGLDVMTAAAQGAARVRFGSAL